MNEPPELPPQKNRGLLWCAFWLLFLMTPALVISMPMIFRRFPALNVLRDYGLLELVVTLLGGSFATAFIFARLCVPAGGPIILRTLGFGILFTVLFGLIGLGGCVWIK